MSESNYTTSGRTRDKRTRDLSDHERKREQPGIGLVATENNSEAIARSILRAQQRNYRVFVTYSSKNEGVTFARQLGATVITPPESDTAVESESFRQLLLGAAEASDCSGLIFISEPEKRVDFERSVSRLEEKTVCEAAYESAADHASILVGIPAYNESATIADVVESSLEVTDAVIVVDDGSDDDTATRARDAGALVVEHERNRGYGAALQTLFAEASNRTINHLAILDGDGQHDPADIPKLVSTQQETNAELIVGSRFVEDGDMNAPRYRRAGLWVINVLTNLSMGVIRPQSTVSDTQSGFRVYSREAIASLTESNDIGDDMQASTDILYHAHSNDFDIEEVGTTVDYDVDNASSRNPITHGMSLVNNILKTVEKERPILFLGIPGLLFILLGLGFGYWTVSHYLSVGRFPLGLALVSATFGLFGTFASFTAIILHSLNQYLE